MTFDLSNALHSGQGFFPSNLVAIGHCQANWPLLDPSWPLHDHWPQQCILLWSVILPTKFGDHRAFLSNLTPGWSQMTPAWPLTQQFTTRWSGVLFTKFGSHRAFLRQIDPRMTFDPRWGRFKNEHKLCGPIPYPHANFQLNTPKHDETHSRTYIHTYIQTLLFY